MKHFLLRRVVEWRQCILGASDLKRNLLIPLDTLDIIIGIPDVGKQFSFFC